MNKYRLIGLLPEVPEGHEFFSDIPDLQCHTELWQKECPYFISDKNLPYVSIEGVDIS